MSLISKQSRLSRFSALLIKFVYNYWPSKLLYMHSTESGICMYVDLLTRQIFFCILEKQMKWEDSVIL